MQKVAISACLLGETCRYDAASNHSEELLILLRGYELIAFCPEDFAFGSPRPTMDLILNGDTIEAISNATQENLSKPIIAYAKEFFDTHNDITLFIGKERSPSCGVCSSKLYDSNKNLLHTQATGLMAQEAQKRAIPTWNAQSYSEKFRIDKE